MNIYEMFSFDLQDFIGRPAGILIIAGIVFLLVGIIIFLKEGKKASKPVEEKKVEEKPADVQAVAATEAKPQEEAAPAPVEAPAVEPIQEATPIVVNATNDGVNEVPVPAVAETLNISEPAQVEAPAVESPVAPVVEAPAPEVTPAAPEVAPAAPEVAPVVESLDAPQPTVYGGASPEVKDVTVEEKPREIYGGANPLENTAPIPTEAVKEAAPEVAPVAPEVTPAAPEVAPAVEAPAPEVTPAAPEVAPAAPEVAPVTPEAPKEEIEKLEF